MAGIQAKNTKPEVIIRKALFQLGYRYKIHDNNLPGKPDLVFPKYHAVIFIHGCFWHAHDCHLFKWPSTRIEFWHTKITGNKERDKRHLKSLLSSKWRVMTIWECSLKGKYQLNFEKIIQKTDQWLQSSNPIGEISADK